LKKLTKNLVALLCCAFLLATMFNGTMKVKANAAATKDPVTLTLLIDNQNTLVSVNATIAAFEKKTGIKTEIELKPSGAEGDNVLKTRLATGDMTDLVWYNTGSLFTVLNPAANFVDITNEPFVATLDNAFKTTVTDKGKVYGIPGGSSFAGGWLYNKKVYAKLGLKVPKTWAELLNNCAKIKAAKLVPVIGSYKDSWTAQLILLSDYYNVQAKMPTFANLYNANKAKYATTPIALRAWEKQQQIFKLGYMNKEFLTTNLDAALKMLADGKGAMYPMLTALLANIQKASGNKVNDIGFFPQPGDDPNSNGITVWEPAGVYISKLSKNIDAAKQWLAFYISPEAIAIQAALEKPQGPYVVKGAKLPADAYPAVKDMIPYFNAGKTCPALEFVSPLKGPNCPQLTVQNGSGVKTPKQNAAEYDKDVEKQAKQIGTPGW
jgi:raffinose/stachyose/melibiose transport system substrate-binding protein